VRSSALLENASGGDKQGRSRASVSCAGRPRSLWKPQGRSGTPLPQKQKAAIVRGLIVLNFELLTDDLCRPRPTGSELRL